MSTIDEDFLIAALSSLVRIPRVNSGGNERAVAACIVGWLRQETRAQLQTIEFEPGRPSIAAVIKGRGGAPSLTLNGHTDTVPIENRPLWSVDPFGALYGGRRMFGRGACDMKAGLAVALTVARVLSRGCELAGDLILHFVAGEETAEPGTASLISAGYAWRPSHRAQAHKPSGRDVRPWPRLPAGERHRPVGTWKPGI